MPKPCAALLNASRGRFRHRLAGAAATLDAVPLDAGFPIRHKANHRPPDVGAAYWLRRRLSSRARPCRARPSRPGGLRSATETELARGERFMVSGPMRLEALKQTDGHANVLP